MNDTQATTEVAEPITAEGLRQLRILIEEGASGYTRHTVASLLAERDRKVAALNAASAINGVHERTIARLQGQSGAEPVDTPVARPRETLVHLHFIDPDTRDRSTWIGTCEHRALLRNADGRRVLEVMIDVDAAPQPVEPPRGFRVGDLVEITVRHSEGEHTPPGLRLIGRTGYVTEIDDNPEYPIGVGVEGWLGPVWCDSGEIRHADIGQDAPVETAGSAL